MKFSISFKYSNVTFKNKETKETIAYDTKASEGNTFTFDNVDEDVVIGMLKGLKDRKASQLFAYDDLRTNFINVMARNKCKELYDKLDKAEWKIEDIAISNITIKDVEFTKPTMNAREAITVESISKKNYTKGHYPTYVVKERLVDLIEGCPKENPMWADLIDIYEKYYGEYRIERPFKYGYASESIDGEYDDEDVGDGQWHVFDYGHGFPYTEQYMIMAPTGDTWPATSSGAVCAYDGEYSYSTRMEMED